MKEEIEHLVVQMAKENPGWGYERIVGAMANLGHRLSDQTVGQHSPSAWPLSCAPSASFIRAHREVLVGTDFFTVEVLTLKGLVTYHVLFFTHLESRRVSLGGMTPYPEVDGAASTKCAHGGVGIPERLPIPVARPRYEVLCVIS